MPPERLSRSRVSVTNRQQVATVNRGNLLCLTGFLAGCLRPCAAAWHSLSIVLADDARMKALKTAWFGIALPTDVIAFSFEPAPGAETGRVAEIHINVETALSEGLRRSHHARARWSPDRELALYLAHGLDHLDRGDEDRTPAGRARMRRRELRWLHAADLAGCLQPLLSPNRTAGSRPPRRRS